MTPATTIAVPRAKNVEVPTDKVRAFCTKWGLSELALFGSVLRGDFRPESDVDILVTFASGRAMTFEAYLEMRDELSAMFGGRPVDLVEKPLLSIPYRRHEILTTRRVVYAA